MDHTMVLSYDYSNQNRQRRRTNASPYWAISMTMVVRRCDTEHIDVECVDLRVIVTVMVQAEAPDYA
jgi:hypothetical protein